MRIYYSLIIVLASCTVPDKTSLKVMRETRSLKKSPVVLRATNHGKVTDDKLELRKNNSFNYYSQVLGTQKIAVYAGTFTQNGDTLDLNFHRDYKDSSWTNKAVIDHTQNTITILSKDTSLNKLLIIRGK